MPPTVKWNESFILQRDLFNYFVSSRVSVLQFQVNIVCQYKKTLNRSIFASKSVPLPIQLLYLSNESRHRFCSLSKTWAEIYQNGFNETSYKSNTNDPVFLQPGCT